MTFEHLLHAQNRRVRGEIPRLLTAFGIMLSVACTQLENSGMQPVPTAPQTEGALPLETEDGHYKCPSCGRNLYWTGETATEWGKKLKQYWCLLGHEYWYVSRPHRKSQDSEDACPVCGMRIRWLGETRFEWGRLRRVYECAAGHYSVK